MRGPSRVDDEPYDEEPLTVRALRDGARIVAMSLVVTGVIGGGYLMIYGRGGAQAQVAAGQPSASTSTSVAQPTSTPSPKPSAGPSFADRVQAALAKLPQGTLSAADRRTALAVYDAAIGL